jgi:hypothetical protein
MPTWTNINADNFENFQIAFNRYMEYFVSHLNSKNVKRLDTNETVIKSKDGKTIIVGPLLLMYDEDGVLRLKQGLDESSNIFVFELLDGIITGGLLRTAVSGSRMEITEGGIKSYNSSGQLHGLYYDPAAAYANFKLYYNGNVYFEIERMPDASGLLISAFGNQILGFNNGTNLVIPRGEWDFSTTTGVYGLEAKGYAIDSEIRQWVEDNFQPL